LQEALEDGGGVAFGFDEGPDFLDFAGVKEHKPERSLERLVDMEVSRKEGFEFLEGLAEGEADF